MTQVKSLLLLLIITAFTELQCYAEPLNVGDRISIELRSNDSCPPGFSGTPCKCDASDYKGMTCFQDRAYLTADYWFGECENGTFCTGKCPLDYCTYNGTRDYQLPGSISELDEYMCGPTRTGVLCGECRDNHSVSYHLVDCVSDDMCNYGVLLYIVSELIPLTVMFIIVIAFNISFTSGAVNGFILFAQIQDWLATHPSAAFQRRWYGWPYQFVYQFFSFNFFRIRELSFCLWRGATVLDAKAFKYVTIACALLLVLFSVCVMKSTKVKRCFPCLRPTTLRSTLIYGLTAFFVMCYTQCARVSFDILRPISLYGVHNHFLKTVVFSSGQLGMMGPTHLKYAIPALLFGSAIVILPPIVLILYPLMFKILARCNLSESKSVNCLSRLVPMQLLDSFQNCFRDNVRFFAGLYFLYRLAVQIIWSIILGIDNFKMIYALLTIMFILILAVHATVQPYKQRMYNVFDGVIFADLTIICSLSLFDWESNFGLVSGIQLVLFYLPLVCVLSIGFFRLLKTIVRYCKKKCSKSRQAETTPLLIDSCDLPPLREVK